jgi:hypothetical protein
MYEKNERNCNVAATAQTAEGCCDVLCIAEDWELMTAEKRQWE